MKLYDWSIAPNPRRVRIYLREKGIDIPIEEAGYPDKPILQPEYLAAHPHRRVPLLVLDDGTEISEAMAICRYFEEIQPDPPLFGRDAKEKAEVEMWSRRAELNIMTCVAAGFRHTSDFFKGLEDQVPAWGELNKGKAPERFTWLDGVLADREFVAGTNYSVADITALIAVDFARVVGLKVTDEWPNLARWHGAMSARPSAKA